MRRFASFLRWSGAIVGLSGLLSVVALLWHSDPLQVARFAYFVTATGYCAWMLGFVVDPRRIEDF